MLSRGDRQAPIGLLDLQPQDRVVVYEHIGSCCGDHRFQEEVYYVECVDNCKCVVHVLSRTGGRSKIRFEDIVDIQKSELPILVNIPVDIWDLHKCDPCFRNRPVRALAVQVFDGRIITGVVVPKWPGSRPGAWLHLPNPSIHETALIRNLPSMGFNLRRFGDPATTRNNAMSAARRRVGALLKKSRVRQSLHAVNRMAFVKACCRPLTITPPRSCG